MLTVYQAQKKEWKTRQTRSLPLWSLYSNRGDKAHEKTNGMFLNTNKFCCENKRVRCDQESQRTALDRVVRKVILSQEVPFALNGERQEVSTTKFLKSSGQGNSVL